MFNDQDVRELLFNPIESGSGGSYNHRTWSTFSGSESESIITQLTSLHESFHNELNNFTLYGNVLSAYAHLADYHEEETYEVILNNLVTRCRKAHEMYATFLSCSVISVRLKNEVNVEKDLLQDYPNYISYYKQSDQIVSAFKGNYLKELALGAIVISCFQDQDFIETILSDLRSFQTNLIRNKCYPDSRLQFIARNLPSNFLKDAFEKFANENKGEAGVLVFRNTEENIQNYFLAIDEQYDDLQQKLNKYFVKAISDWMSDYGYKSVDLSVNFPMLEDLYRRTNTLLKGSTNQMVLNEEQFNNDRNVLLNFTAERYVVRENPIEAHVHILEEFGVEDWHKFSSGVNENEHYFIVSRMPERLISQYLFNQEARTWLSAHKGMPQVFLRRRVVIKSKGIEVVEFFLIRSVSILQQFVKQVSNTRIISNVSLHAWSVEEWAAEWLGQLSNKIILTILFDLAPHAQLQNLFGEGCELLKINKAWIQHPDYRHCALVIEAQIDKNYESPLFFIPASLITCNVISSYIFKDFRKDFVTEDDIFMKKHKWQINVVTEHLFNEEYYFDFNV